MLAGQRPASGTPRPPVELAADPRDLRLRHPVEAQRLHQLVDLPRRDAVHVGFLHDGQQRVLGAPARLQQRGEIRPRPHLRDRQLDRARPACPRSASGSRCGTPVRSGVRSCRSAPIRPATSVSISACESTRMPSRRTSAVLLLEELANKRRQIHSGLGHRVNTSVSSFSGQRELTERCAMACPDCRKLPRTDVLGVDQLNAICPWGDVEAAGLTEPTKVEEHRPGIVQQGEDPQRAVGGDQVEIGMRRPSSGCPSPRS